MILTVEEQDAIGEIVNISVGAAACYLGNLAEIDVDVSIPNFTDVFCTEDIKEEKGKKSIYRMDFTAFSFGMCSITVINNYDKVCKYIGCSTDDASRMEKVLGRIVENAIEPLERLMEQTVNLTELYNSENYMKSELVRFGNEIIQIGFLCSVGGAADVSINYYFPAETAKKVANRFIRQGIALTMV